MPPFKDVIKGRAVEDPVNLWVHRPLAYGLVATIHRTSITPNQVTFVALLFGLAAAACWFVGTPSMMVLGGALLWSSAILDGADGILARAKNAQSELGRALDGIADMVVALATTAAAFYHIWMLHNEWFHLLLMPVALVGSVLQVYTYDFYKEVYLRSTNPAWDGRTDTLANTRASYARALEDNAPLIVRFGWWNYVGMLTGQQAVIRATDARAIRDGKTMPVSEETVRIHKRHNYWPMQLWTALSLCPHTYLLSICAMLDRLDVYLWFRAVVATVLYLTALGWQRYALTRTLQDLEQARPPGRPAIAASGR